MHDALRKYINGYTSSIISDTEFKHVQEAFSSKKVKKRQFLLHEGSICQYTAFIVKGAMRQYLIDDRGVEQRILQYLLAMLFSMNSIF